MISFKKTQILGAGLALSLLLAACKPGGTAAATSSARLEVSCLIDGSVLHDSLSRVRLDIDAALVGEDGDSLAISSNLDSMAISLVASVDDSMVVNAYFEPGSPHTNGCNPTSMAVLVDSKEEKKPQLLFDVKVKGIPQDDCLRNRLKAGGLIVIVTDALPDPEPHHHLEVVGVKAWKGGESVPAILK